jgi:hypothetical protein
VQLCLIMQLFAVHSSFKKTGSTAAVEPCRILEPGVGHKSHSHIAMHAACDSIVVLIYLVLHCLH